MNALKKTVQFGLPNLRTWIQCAAWSRLAKHLLPNAGTLIVLGLLAIVPAMELQSSTQVFSRIGMADGDGGGY